MCPLSLSLSHTHRELYIPAELAYGGQQRGSHIKPNSVLVFTLQLIEVKGAAQPASATEL